MTCTKCGEERKRMATKALCRTCHNSERGKKKQRLGQMTSKRRIVFKMRCKSCDQRLCKESYIVDYPYHPDVEKTYREFYQKDHYCNSCGPAAETPFKDMVREHALVQLRSR